MHMSWLVGLARLAHVTHLSAASSVLVVLMQAMHLAGSYRTVRHYSQAVHITLQLHNTLCYLCKNPTLAPGQALNS